MLGKRAVVPLYALKRDDKDNVAVKNELAGIPPIRDKALTIYTTELVTFEEGEYGTAVSTRLKDKDAKAKELRVEPLRPDEFKSALALACAVAHC